MPVLFMCVVLQGERECVKAREWTASGAALLCVRVLGAVLCALRISD